MKTVSLDSLIFRHQTSDYFDVLKPVPYERISEIRDSEEYMKSRLETEDMYRALLEKKGVSIPRTTSFLYSTLVGYHKMEHPSSYPGYTFYFKLTKEEIEKTVFEVVDKRFTLGPKVGLKALEDCMRFWNSRKKQMSSYEDEVAGLIYPRIEVVISYPVYPYKFVTQIEDR
jgi:hypothetical protein